MSYFKDFLHHIMRVRWVFPNNFHPLQFALILIQMRVRLWNVFNMTHCISFDAFISAHDFFFFSELSERELINYETHIQNPHTWAHSHFCFHKISLFSASSLSHSLLLVVAKNKSSNGKTQKRVLKKSIFITHRRWTVRDKILIRFLSNFNIFSKIIQHDSM